MSARYLAAVAVLLALAASVGSGRAHDAACGSASGTATANRHPGGLARPPVWSPDGRRIMLEGSPETGIDALYVVEVATGAATMAAPTKAWFPDWSPDSRRIAFSHPVLTGVVTAQANGKRPRRIASDGGSPEWSPDGCWIAYEKRFDLTAAVRPDGSGARVLGEGDEPSWSPDGRRLAFSDGDIWVVDLPDGEPRLLISPPGVGIGPVWSPDGDEIAYAMGPPDEGNFHPTWTGGTIFVVDVATGLARRVASGNAPAWAPDGSRILFVRIPRRGPATIASVRPDGSELRVLGRGGTASWSPDGRRIAFHLGGVWVMNADGSSRRPLVRAQAGPPDAPRLRGTSVRAARARLRAAGYRPAAAGAPAQLQFRALTMDVGPAPSRWIVCARRIASTPVGYELQLIATPRCPLRVPRVVGLTRAAAVAKLAAVGLYAEEPEPSLQPRGPGPALVCRQDPPAGAIVRVRLFASVFIGLGRRCR